MVILSLVRSNPKGKIRFLKERNRLVVGSSRQKSALYIVGNCSFLKKNSPVVWKVGTIHACSDEYLCCFYHCIFVVCRYLLRGVKGSTLEGLDLAYPLWLVATSRSVRHLKSWIRGNGHDS